MNMQRALILIVSVASLLSGCTTTNSTSADEARLKELLDHRSWPRIEQIARTEVKKREVAWPDTAAYLPEEHTKRVWIVTALSGTPDGDVGRVVILWISDDGDVLDYQRHSDGLR